MHNVSDSKEGWSICLASVWPKKVDVADVAEEKRLNIPIEEAIRKAGLCQKRMNLDGRYLNGACPGCVFKHRLDLECLN